MSKRESKMLLLKDMVEHLRGSQQQLQWTENPEMIRMITETMIRDLESCRTLCEELNRKARIRQAV